MADPDRVNGARYRVGMATKRLEILSEWDKLWLHVREPPAPHREKSRLKIAANGQRWFVT